MQVSQAKRLKELENENNRLKKLVADLSLDKAILKEADWRLKNKGQLIEEYEERREKLIGDRFDKLIEKCLPTDEDREMFVKFLNTFMGLVEEKAFLLETVMIDGKETYIKPKIN